MSDTPATRASDAPQSPNGPTGGHGDGGASTMPIAARTARIVIHESDACQGNITGWDCEDCEDDACEHECHDTEPAGDLGERLMEALRTVGLARNLAAYRDAVLPVFEEALAEVEQLMTSRSVTLRRRAEQAEAAVERVRRLQEMTIASSCRVQAIDQARDTLRVLEPPKETRG